MDKLQELLGNGKYSEALTLCSSIELQIHENLDTTNPEIAALFYTLNMIAFLIVGDLNGAKYLWKRSHDLLKSSNFSLAGVWNIGKMLWNDDVANALIATKVNWPDTIAVHMKSLSNELVRQQLESFSAGFSVVSLATVSYSLALSKEDTLNMMLTLGWRVDVDSALVYPLRATIESANKLSAVEKLQDNLKLMDKITSHAAHFEKLSAKVDLNAKNETIKVK